MPDSLQALRDRIEQWYGWQAGARVERWRGAPLAHHVVATPLTRALLGEESVDAIEAARASGRIAAPQAAWLHAHLERIRLALKLSGRRLRFAERVRPLLDMASGDSGVAGQLRELLGSHNGPGRGELARHLEARACDLVADHLELQAAVRELAPPAPTDPALTTGLQGFLEGTDALAGEVLGALRLSPGRGARPWADLLVGLRAHGLDGLTSARERSRRMAAVVEGLGFGKDLARAVRVERHESALSPTPELAVLLAPDDVRIGVPALDYGAWADQCTARALGHALSVALVSRGLHTEQRWPVPGGGGALLGALCAQLPADPICARRALGYSGRDAERFTRHQAGVLLLTTRLQCAVALAGPGRDAHDAMERLEQAAERALGVPVPGALLALFGAHPEALFAAHSGVAALALGQGLREHHDVDWFRNPHVGELIRGVCVQGAAATCADLSALAPPGSAGAPVERVRELLA